MAPCSKNLFQILITLINLKLLTLCIVFIHVILGRELILCRCLWGCLGSQEVGAL